MENSNLSGYLNKVCEYWWNYSHKDSRFMKQEKQFINNCLNLIDLSVFPDVPAGFIDETRRLILSAMEEDGYDPEFLTQITR